VLDAQYRLKASNRGITVIIRRSSVLLALLLLMLLPVFAWGADGAALSRDLPPGLQVPAAATAGPDFDVERATEAYLNLLSLEQRAQSDAYFEGGYWLQLWQLLYGLGASVLLLATGWSRRMRDRAQRISARPWLSTALYAAMFLLATQVISLPLSIYTDYIREHAYGLSTQSFGAWLADQAKGSAIALVIMPFVIAGLYALLRRAGERWWLYAGMASFVLILFVSMIAPVFVAPLFNDYKPLPAGEVRESILSLARANRIPTEHVEWFDASRQTTRVSANVSGFAGTTRVNLNDNLLKKTSLPEIKAVMGHEMGHYVLNHSLRLPLYFSLLIAFGFWFVHATFDRAQRRWGQRFGVEGRADPAGLPLISALFSMFFFFATPVSNSIVRQAEAEADAYGLNAAGEPHGFATAAMRLSTYRKIHPGKWEEAIFYDHPSGYDRVRRSMEWLKEHPQAGRRAP
jgi:STE24 endopeptidase